MKSQTIWTQCGAKSNLKTLECDACRVVEYPYRSVTRKLVDSPEEHQLLEDAIEAIKPPSIEGADLHFLLSTPFRYPPLKHGSRFGATQHKGIWYGSLAERTAFAERAYYLFRFFNDSEAEISIESEFTLFWTRLRSRKAADLTREPFLKFKDEISDRASYETSQQLGDEMRAAGVEFVKFISARDREQGINVAVFSSKSFASTSVRDSDCTNWSCFANGTRVEFRRKSFVKDDEHVFDFSEFAVRGHLPVPKN